jgi:hypothetical protein
VREEAAMLCAIAASTPDLDQSYRAVCDALDIGCRDDDGNELPFFDLALQAWAQAAGTSRPDAEAECLLRTGWSPGDEP